MFKARIRGIYSTALTNILLRKGFEIVQPSVTLEERFNLEEIIESPDIDVKDRIDRQGVEVRGNCEAVAAFIVLMKENLVDVIIRMLSFSLGGIYKGIIEKMDSNKGLALVDIGSAKTWLKIHQEIDLNQREIIVQIKEERLRQPILDTNLTIQGKYVVLIKASEPKLSRMISDPKVRQRLYELALELKPKDWNILWRTSSSTQPTDTLKEEIKSLTDKVDMIDEKKRTIDAPAIILEGECFTDVEFPAKSKHILDEVRGQITPTVLGHHFYKVCSVPTSTAVDMAEALIERGTPKNEAARLLYESVEANLPMDDSIIFVEHVKLDGRVLNLGKAMIDFFDQDSLEIKFSRLLKGGGIYDGFGTRIKVEDRAVTEGRIGDWYLRTKYFSDSGQYKGEHINFNTPVELYLDRIRYVDLEVDVITYPDGKIEVVDLEKLEEAFKKGLITENLVRIIKEKLKEILVSFNENL